MIKQTAFADARRRQTTSRTRQRCSEVLNIAYHSPMSGKTHRRYSLGPQEVICIDEGLRGRIGAFPHPRIYGNGAASDVPREQRHSGADH